MYITNIKNLLREYFISNWRKDSTNIFAPIAALSFFFSLTTEEEGIIYFIIYVALIVITSRIFKRLWHKPSAIQYLTLPASTVEKWLTAVILANVYAVALVIFSAWVGYTAAYFAAPLFSDGFVYPYMDIFADTIAPESVVTLFTLIAVLFFGSVYYRRRAAVKTFLTVFVASLAYFIFATIVFYINIRMHGAVAVSQFEFTSLDVEMDGEIMYYVACGIVSVFCYFLSFLRLKETEA